MRSRRGKVSANMSRSSRGPSVKISSGTLANGDVVVREDRPIRMVIPTLREKLGL